MSTQDSPSEQQRLYEATLVLEDELKLAMADAFLSARVTSLRQRIRDNYETLLLADVSVASKKDLEQQLWKGVFYRMIDEYRKGIRSKTKSGKSSRESAKMASFRAFLADGIAYYSRLLERVRTAYALDLQAFIVEGTQVTPEQLSGYQTCHRCLVSLGDLARYQEMYKDGGKTWATAAAHYRHATRLFPNNGSPHNQLAVLATYENDQLEAAYCYFRSLSSWEPFLVARNNLSLLFERNRVAYARVRTSRMRVPPESQTVKEIISDWTVCFLRALDDVGSDELYLTVVEQVIREIPTLVEIKFLHGETSLRLVAICIHSVSSGMKTRSLALLFRLVCAILTAVFPRASVPDGDRLRGADHLPAVALLLDWLVGHPEYFTEMARVPEGPDLLGRELFKATCFMWDALAAVLNLIVLRSPSLPRMAAGKMPNVFLREHVDLLGFLPLKDVLQPLVANCSSRDIEQNLQTQSDPVLLDELRYVRIVAGAMCIASTPTEGTNWLVLNTSTNVFLSAHGCGRRSSQGPRSGVVLRSGRRGQCSVSPIRASNKSAGASSDGLLDLLPSTLFPSAPASETRLSRTPRRSRSPEGPGSGGQHMTPSASPHPPVHVGTGLLEEQSGMLARVPDGGPVHVGSDQSGLTGSRRTARTASQCTGRLERQPPAWSGDFLLHPFAEGTPTSASRAASGEWTHERRDEMDVKRVVRSPFAQGVRVASSTTSHHQLSWLAPFG